MVIIGRLVPIKNHKLFLDSFKYCNDNSNTKLKALIVGDGDLTTDLIKYSDKIGFKTNYKLPDKNADVIFTSWIKEVDHVLAGSDIVCLTSINEGTPISIIEAIVSKRACISTNVGGISDIIDDDINGCVVNADYVSFGNKLKILAENKFYRNKIANQGFKECYAKFNHLAHTKNIEELYNNVLNEK